MLTERQTAHCRKALATRGVNAWHIRDADAPQIVKDYGGALAESSIKPAYIDALCGTNYEPFERVRWSGKRMGYITLHPEASPEPDISALLRQPTNSRLTRCGSVAYAQSMPVL